MTFEEFLGEIKTDLSQYFESGLIDDASVLRWVNQALKKFGPTIMIFHEAVVEVENSKGKLPENFFSLSKALKCTKSHIRCNKDTKKILVKSLFWTDVQLKQKGWEMCDECGDSETDIEEYTISEKTYIDGTMFDKVYKNPVELRLSPMFKKSVCADECFNKYNSNSPFEINIIGNTMYTNFKEGDVYVKYKGLELDENGITIIPETPKGEVETYVMYFVKRNIFEIVLVNSQDTNIANIFKYFVDMERSQLALAITEAKFMGLTPSSMYKLRSRGILERKKFERIPRR